MSADVLETQAINNAPTDKTSQSHTDDANHFVNSSPTNPKAQPSPLKNPRHDHVAAISSPANIDFSPSHHTSDSSRHSTPATSAAGSIDNPLASAKSPSLPSSSAAPPIHSTQPAADTEHPLASIKPAYFYPLDANSSAQDGIPVFEPTMEQFQDFYAFCQAIDRWGMQSGIVKVVPPKEWRDALPDLRPTSPLNPEPANQSPNSADHQELADLSKVRIRNAIQQHFTPAGSGVWRQTNVTRTVKVWNPKQWSEACIARGQKGPEMDRMKWKVEVEGVSNNGWGPKNIGNKDETHSAFLEEDGVRTRSGKNRPSNLTADVKAGVKRKRSRDKSHEPDESFQTPPASQERGAQESKDVLPSAELSPTKAKKNWAAEATSFDEWRHFDYRNVWLKEGLSHDEIAQLDHQHSDSTSEQDQSQSAPAPKIPQPTDWNEETCREIESEYWRSLNFGKPPMYGADLKGTLFDHRTKHWNVGHLDNVLNRLRLKRKLPGVNTPYLYWGMWRATFAWHVEDMDLYSINYIHFGAPKQWYSIRQADRQRFESAMAGAFPTDSRRCPHFMRHKSYLASPSFLASHGIRPLKLVHHAGEFVITYPYGYHSGFNLGFNCAESVNFALESWLDIGRKANYCHCDQSQNSVRIDVDAMLEESKEMEELERKREIRRAKEDSIRTIEEEELERRRIKNEKAKERRRLKKEQEAASTGAVALPFQGGADFYIDAKAVNTSPCIFCPANVTSDLVETPADISSNNARLRAMANRHAHRLCASFIPETWVGKQGKSDVVCGIEGIDKARFSLKCQICPNANLQKLYPKIQCTRGKCPRSAHVSCALVEEHGWFVDVCTGEVADRLEGKKQAAASMQKKGTEVAPTEKSDEERLVVLCRTHNPLFREAEEARKAEALRDRISALDIPSLIRIKTSGGMYDALMVEVMEDEDEVVIEDQGRPSTVKFHQIILESEDESPGSSDEEAPKVEPVKSEQPEAKRVEEQPVAKRRRRASRKAEELAAVPVDAVEMIATPPLSTAEATEGASVASASVKQDHAPPKKTRAPPKKRKQDSDAPSIQSPTRKPVPAKGAQKKAVKPASPPPAVLPPSITVDKVADASASAFEPSQPVRTSSPYTTPAHMRGPRAAYSSQSPLHQQAEHSQQQQHQQLHSSQQSSYPPHHPGQPYYQQYPPLMQYSQYQQHNPNQVQGVEHSRSPYHPTYYGHVPNTYEGPNRYTQSSTPVPSAPTHYNSMHGHPQQHMQHAVSDLPGHTVPSRQAVHPSVSQYGHPSAPAVDVMDRVPPLPTYAGQLPQQHTYQQPPRLAHSTQGYGSGFPGHPAYGPQGQAVHPHYQQPSHQSYPDHQRYAHHYGHEQHSAHYAPQAHQNLSQNGHYAHRQ